MMVAAAGLLIMSCGNGNSNKESDSYEAEGSELFEDAGVSEYVDESIEEAVESIGDAVESIENLEAIAEELEEETEEETATTSSSSNDFDEVLDSYEEYVDKYVSYMKKAQNGDMSALAEYPALMEKAQELNKKIEKSKGEMTTAQITRYTQITSKMATAMQ